MKNLIVWFVIFCAGFYPFHKLMDKQRREHAPEMAIDDECYISDSEPELALYEAAGAGDDPEYMPTFDNRPRVRNSDIVSPFAIKVMSCRKYWQTMERIEDLQATTQTLCRRLARSTGEQYQKDAAAMATQFYEVCRQRDEARAQNYKDADKIIYLEGLINDYREILGINYKSPSQAERNEKGQFIEAPTLTYKAPNRAPAADNEPVQQTPRQAANARLKKWPDNIRPIRPGEAAGAPETTPGNYNRHPDRETETRPTRARHTTAQCMTAADFYDNTPEISVDFGALQNIEEISGSDDEPATDPDQITHNRPAPDRKRGASAAGIATRYNEPETDDDETETAAADIPTDDPEDDETETGGVSWYELEGLAGNKKIEVFRAKQNGANNKAIAAMFGISPESVRGYVSQAKNILRDHRVLVETPGSAGAMSKWATALDLNEAGEMINDPDWKYHRATLTSAI